MTSSLVGSEMCIRDRYFPDADDDRIDGHGAAAAHKGAGYQCAAGRSNHPTTTPWALAFL
eukprot:6342214-Prorocentrum_lima.AAC.1